MNEGLYNQILNSPEFNKLREIGGGQEFHQEGDAYIHSLLVWRESFSFWQEDREHGIFNTMNLVALLHDIGKIYTGRPKDNGDWEYPNHAKVGAEHLPEFLPAPWNTDQLLIDTMKWYISNHVKPLFWKKFPEYTEQNVNLAKLAICDIRSSYSRDTEAQEKKIEFLTTFINQQQ